MDWIQYCLTGEQEAPRDQGMVSSFIRAFHNYVKETANAKEIAVQNDAQARMRGSQVAHAKGDASDDWATIPDTPVQDIAKNSAGDLLKDFEKSRKTKKGSQKSAPVAVDYSQNNYDFDDRIDGMYGGPDYGD